MSENELYNKLQQFFLEIYPDAALWSVNNRNMPLLRLGTSSILHGTYSTYTSEQASEWDGLFVRENLINHCNENRPTLLFYYLMSCGTVLFRAFPYGAHNMNKIAFKGGLMGYHYEQQRGWYIPHHEWSKVNLHRKFSVD